MADLFSSLSSGISSLLGLGDTASGYLSTAADLGSAATGIYELYSGLSADSAASDYMSQLLASTELSDELLRAQAERSAEYFEPLENLEATYALEDLQNLRELSLAQQDYAIDKGTTDIEYAQDVVDPLQYSLISQLAEGVDAQQYMDTASTDVQQAYDETMQQLQRANALQGVNVNSGTAQSQALQTALSKAQASAGARTEASRLAEDLDIERKGQALSLWSGIPLTETDTDVSSSSLTNSAVSGFQSAANSLLNAANYSSSLADDYYSGASALFSNIGSYTG